MATAPARREAYTTAFVLDLLVKEALLTPEQRRQIEVREPAMRARILKEKGGSLDERRRAAYEVAPPELIAAMGLKLADGRDLDEDTVTEVVARATKVPYRKIDPLKLDPGLINATFSRPFARRHNALPLELVAATNTLHVAVGNPFDRELLETLRAQTGREIQPVLCAKSDIQRHITDVYGFGKSVVAAAKDISAGVDLGNLEQLVKLRSAEEIEATDKHVVNAVEYVLHFAFEQRASDIHIEPKRDESLIRFRIDGILHNIKTIPAVVHPAFTSRVKMLARMDIAERRKPQDGRIKTSYLGREVEMRVSTLPVAFGEKVVVRIFDPDVLLQDLAQLGLDGAERERYERFIARSHGLILVTGPTGSGKTTTLYSTLRLVASPEVNVVTIEDPIELVSPDLNQVAVQAKAGLGMAQVLRTVLRQDPDIVMVGEIRDLETAENAVQAALTGHLVLSTLHTNDTATSVTRLLDLGVAPYLISSTLVGVVAQRLVRQVCQKCGVDVKLTPDEIATLELPLRPGEAPPSLTVRRGEGCVTCRGTGLWGRMGIFEVLEVTDRIRALLNSRAPAIELAKAARLDGMATLRETAVRRLAEGVTSFEEVIRVTAADET